MKEKSKYQLEFILSTSLDIVYERLSTPTGLEEWFSDTVNIKDNVFSFNWDGSEQIATVIKKKKNAYIRFQWVDDANTDYYFEFKIQKDELTNELALFITDFSDTEDLEANKELWETQVDELKHKLGI